MYNKITKPMWIFSMIKVQSALLISLSFILSWVYSSPICPSGNCCPYYDAQTQECYDVDPNNIHNMPPPHVSRNFPRGGSTVTTTSDSSSSSLSQSPDNDDEEIDYDSISMALRMTCELNRQLMYGTHGMTCAGGHTEQVDHIDFPDSSQTWFHSIQPPSTPSSNTDPDTNAPTSIEPLTIFHAKSPRTLSSSKKKRKLRLKTGCARWGPSLALYLRQLHTSLQCPPITFALALIYLDRACSAETQRNLSIGATACPHLTPRTVHRLVLTAMVIASKAMDATPTNPIQDGNSDKYINLLRTFGISEAALRNMESWMLQALGEKGTWVDAERMKNLWTVWQCAFSDTTNSDNNNNNNNEGGSNQYSGIGLQKELERLYPPVNHNVPEIQEIHPSMQQQQLHSQWQDSNDSNPRVIHIRREQHIVHVHRPEGNAPNNAHYNNEHPSTSYTQTQQPVQGYNTPPPSEQNQNNAMYTPNPPTIVDHHPPQQTQHSSSDYLGPSGGYLREDSDPNLTEYYARA